MVKKNSLPPTPICRDCSREYPFDDLDTVLSNEQWAMIHSEGPYGLLCANCIVKRASVLPGIIAARMYLEFTPDTDDDIRNVQWLKDEDGWYWKADLYKDGLRIGVTGNYYCRGKSL